MSCHPHLLYFSVSQWQKLLVVSPYLFSYSFLVIEMLNFGLHMWLAWNKKGTFSHPLLMLGGVINNADHRDRGIMLCITARKEIPSKGEGCPSLIPDFFLCAGIQI